MTSMRLIEGFTEFSDGLEVSAECFGRDYATHIAGVDVTISLAPIHAETSMVGEPEWVTAAPNGVRIKVWGEITSRVASGPICGKVTAARFAFEVPDSDDAALDVAKSVAIELESWTDRFESWIDATTDLDLAGLGRRGPTTIGPRIPAWHHTSGGEVRWISFPLTLDITLPDLNRQFPTSSLLQNCFTLAGRGDDLPPEWQFIRDAKSYLYGGDERHAVIDAATAAEIALEKQIPALLATLAPPVAKYLDGKFIGIGGRAQLFTMIGGSIPAKIQQLLAEPRNAAAHRGTPLSWAEAKRAVEIAREIVNQATPIAGLMP